MADSITRLNAALEGRYRIEREVGAGGMATVYLAQDLKHERQVAIKVLKSEIANALGADRFLAEIKTTANLQHPHILPLHDSGEAEGKVFYVMPYVEGESLRDRLTREHQLPVDEAVRLATEMTEALGYAHRQGVVHRDIKPANILLHEGKPLVADFGIALATGSVEAGRLTETGLSLGTPVYMSPEQATGGQPVGPLSDTYSLGCVLYEMLVGEPPFAGATPASILGKIVTGEAPSAAAQRKTVPPNVDAAIARALEKVPADRFRSMAEFAAALADDSFRHGATVGGRAVESGVWKKATVGIAALFVVVSMLALMGWLRPVPGPPGPVIRSSLEPPSNTRLTADAGFALSPDGRRLAFVAQGADGVVGLWVQSLSELEARLLEGTEGAFQPFWSPDGRDLGFFTVGRLKRVPVSGGAVQVLAEPIPQGRGGAWSPEGRIVFAPDYRTGLFEVAADGGEARALTELNVDDGELSHRWPRFLPDGRTLLFLVQTAEQGADDDRSRIEALDPEGARHEILGVNASAAYSRSGQLLFWRGGSLYAQELDSRGWRLKGDPQLVAASVGLSANEWAAFSASGEGTLVYHLGTALPWRLEWRDRFGNLVSVEGLPGDYSYPALSPDGRSVAYVAEGGVWVLDVPRGTRTRLTFEEVDHYSPAWSPDGAWLAYPADKEQGAGGEIYRRPSSGLGERELLFSGPSGRPIQDISWSRDGRWIAFEENGDIFLLDPESRETRTGVAGPGRDRSARFSPNGKWLAYSSDESGRPEVYVVAALGGGRRWQVSSQGGSAPRWSAGGDELFFLGLENEVLVAKVDTGEVPEFGVPESLFTIPGDGPGYDFDVAPDGRILLRTQASTGSSQSFKLILNWPQLLGQPGL